MAITELGSNRQIQDYLQTLREENRFMIALDIEGEFNLHRYGEHLCLVQIFDGEREIIIDPIANQGLTALGELFSERSLLKIMYDASSDASLISHTLGARLSSILDLRQAVALLDYPSHSLSAVLESEFQIPPPNKKAFQQHNWMRRPLSHDAVEYAMNDVRQLYALKDRLLARLHERRLLDLFMLKNIYMQNGQIKPLDQNRHAKAKGYSRLPQKRKALFRELFEARERTARAVDRPPNSVFPNRRLMELAEEECPDAGRYSQFFGPMLTDNQCAGLLKELTGICTRFTAGSRA